MSMDFNIKPVGAPVAVPVAPPVSEAAHRAVATELPGSVTEPDVAEGVSSLYESVAILADSFARMVAFAMSQPEDVDVNEILYRPTAQEL